MYPQFKEADSPNEDDPENNEDDLDKENSQDEDDSKEDPSSSSDDDSQAVTNAECHRHSNQTHERNAPDAPSKLLTPEKATREN